MKKEKMGALDAEGNPIDMDPSDLKRFIEDIFSRGEPLAIVLRKKVGGEEAILIKMFFSPEDLETTSHAAECLQQGADTLRAIVKRSGH